ncbi:glutamate-gated chloride channel [Prorops nasuta]|uniref:glutamate-gated chloride channel n=1 Tax=Prorops nasuta TaxID=863751 RepID=UPI0034D00ADE
MRFMLAAAMWPGVIPLLALLAVLLHPSRCTQAKVNFREKEKQVLDNILGPGRYDARIRPSGENGTDGPTNVKVNIFLRSISKIDDYNMEYSVQLTFREQWLDERLKFNDLGGRLKYLTLTESSRVWMPDLFFSNEKEGHFHNIIMPNVYIRIFPNGSVLYSIRISLTLSCPMNLKLYPLDRQICSLRMASYGWTTDDLVFIWKEGDPVQIVKNLHLPRFTLEKFLTDYCNSKTITGAYSCLKVDLLFKREFSYYLIQIYIPCCMLVIVSWVSFWLDQSAVPARVSLGVTTLLTMATQTSGINASLPPVSYTKAIDVWTGVCLTFVFGALLEFALVNYASRSDMHSDNIKKQFMASETENSSPTEPDGSANFPMVVAVQVPDEIQAHRRHLTDLFPHRIRSLQPHVLVHVPVQGGNAGRVNLDEEALGSRDVVRGRTHHNAIINNNNNRHTSTRNILLNTASPGSTGSSHSLGRSQRSRPRQRHFHDHHQHHHHHHHAHNHHHHQHQHLHEHNHQQRASSRHKYQQDDYEADSAGSFSPLEDRSRRSCRSSSKSSPSSSSSSSSNSSSRSASPSPSPSLSRNISPSPSCGSPRETSFGEIHSFDRGGRLIGKPKCCWGIVPKRWLTCQAQGSARIDIFSRFAFPLTFVVFNIAYWSNYLFQGEEAMNAN